MAIATAATRSAKLSLAPAAHRGRHAGGRRDLAQGVILTIHSWDMHVDLTKRMKKQADPMFDPA